MISQVVRSKLSKNVWKFYIAMFFLGFATFNNEVMSLYYLHFHLTFAQIGLVAAAVLITSMLLEIPSGAFADLYGKKKSVLIGTALWGISLVIVVFSSSFYLFLIAGIILGAGFAFNSGAFNELLYDTLKDLGREKEYLSIMSKATTLYLFIGLFAVLGLLLFGINVRIPQYVSLGGVILSLIVILFLYDFYSPKKVSLKVYYGQIISGIKFTLGHARIMWFMGFTVLFGLVATAFAEFIMQPYPQALGFSLQDIALISLFSVSTQMIFTQFADKVEGRIGERNSLILMIVVVGSSFLLMVFVKNYLLAVIYGLFWAAMTFKELVFSNYINGHLIKENRATVMSVYSMLSYFLAAPFIPLIGFALDLLSFGSTLIILSVLTFGVGALLFVVRLANRAFASA